MRPAYRARQILNYVNGSTLLGLLAGRLGRSTFTRGPDGLILAHNYRFAIPPQRNPAFTIGNVVLIRMDFNEFIDAQTLLRHEARHSTQYTYCFGLPMLPLYLLASGWSYICTGDPASRNFFERQAGLADGGYTERPLRWARTAARS